MENLTPTAAEQKYFKVPDPDRDDREVIFTFHFSILPALGKPQVSFTLWLNQTLQGSGTASDEEEPIVYHFQRDECVFHHTTTEDYYLKGRINIVYVNGPNGQFFGDHCNFSYDITYGKKGGGEHDLLGVYPLLDSGNLGQSSPQKPTATTSILPGEKMASVLASAEEAKVALATLTEVIGAGEESPEGPTPEALQATWEAAQQSAPVLNLAMENLVSAVSSPETLLGKGELHAQMQEAVNTVTETLSTVADQVAVADLKGLTEQEIPVMEIIRPELEVSIRLKLWMLAQTGTEADAAKVEVVTPGEETDSSLITEGVPEKDPISAENQEAIDPPDGKVEGSETETTTSTESGTTDDSTAAEEATDAATEPAQVAKEPTPPDEGAATDASSKEEAPPKTKSTRKKSAK